LNLLGGGSCFVCGNKSSDAADYLRVKLDEHRCPICDSAEEQQEKIVQPAQFSKARLRRLRTAVEKQRLSVSSSTAEIDRLEVEYRELSNAARTTGSKRGDFATN